MIKYTLTNKGKIEANKLKASKLCVECGISTHTISAARKTGIFTMNTLNAFFVRYIPSFTEGTHYTKCNPNAVKCADCQKEMHDTQLHICNTGTTVK